LEWLLDVEGGKGGGVMHPLTRSDATNLFRHFAEQLFTRLGMTERRER
jgi:hypothetical protein